MDPRSQQYQQAQPPPQKGYSQQQEFDRQKENQPNSQYQGLDDAFGDLAVSTARELDPNNKTGLVTRIQSRQSLIKKQAHETEQPQMVTVMSLPAAGVPLPSRAAPALPHAAPALPHAAPALPHAAPALPHAAPALPHAAPALPHAAPALPHAAPALPHAAPALPHAAPALPHAAPALPHAAPALPHAASALPHAASALPHAASALPHAASLPSHAAPVPLCTVPVFSHAAPAVLHADPALSRADPALSHAPPAPSYLDYPPMLSRTSPVPANIPVNYASGPPPRAAAAILQQNFECHPPTISHDFDARDQQLHVQAQQWSPGEKTVNTFCVESTQSAMMSPTPPYYPKPGAYQLHPGPAISNNNPFEYEHSFDQTEQQQQQQNHHRYDAYYQQEYMQYQHALEQQGGKLASAPVTPVSEIHQNVQASWDQFLSAKESATETQQQNEGASFDSCDSNESYLDDEEGDWEEGAQFDESDLAHVIPETFLSPDNLKEFLITPIESNRLVKCIIMYDTVEKAHVFINQINGVRLMKAYKRKDGFKRLTTQMQWAIDYSSCAIKQNSNSTFDENLLPVTKSKSGQDGEMRTAKLKSNVNGSAFEIYDTGLNPYKAIGAMHVRRELGGIKFEKVNDSHRRKVTVCIPALGENFRPTSKKDYMWERLSMGDRAVVELVNHLPQCPMLLPKLSDYKGMAKSGSIKNMMLHDPLGEDMGPIFVMGKNSKKVFSLYFRKPLSPVMAFTIGLASISSHTS